MLLSRNSGCKGMVFILIDKEFLTKKGWISSETHPFFLITYYRENNLFFGNASLTTIGRPAYSAPFNALIALDASEESGISMNANPLDLLVSRSVMILTESTVPYSSITSLKSDSLTL